MKKQIQLILLQLLFFSFLSTGQNVLLEGYIFEDNNRGFLNEVDVHILDASTEKFITKTITDLDGFFTTELPAGKDYILKTSKDLFFPKEEIISTKGKSAGEKTYAKIKLERKPGYIFDVTLAESGVPAVTVDAITGARIEVFNNTKMEETLVIDSLEGINFDVTFEKGNHYSVLIRKYGYFNKRLEAYVDVEGCILCFEGVGTVTPGVSDVMSEGFQMGSVLANIELEPATLNKTVQIENIYYDLNKYYIRDDASIELDKVVKLLNDNPVIIIELGAHTDSRGGTRYNKQLSANRAKAAVEYIINKGGISKNRISFKGYGESQLVNNCSDGVKCSEKEHQKNRRTELKIVGFESIDPLERRSLAEMITEEKLLKEILNAKQIQVRPGEVPDFDKIEKTKATSNKTTSTTSIKNKSIIEPSIQPTNPKKKSKSETSQIISSKSGAETLVEKGDIIVASSPTNTKPNLLSFGEDKVMFVHKGAIELIDKMIGNQLNTRITDMLINKKIFLQKEGDMMTYKFDSIDKMPVDILNVFLSKLAIMKIENGWQLFPLKKGDLLPKEILQSLN